MADIEAARRIVGLPPGFPGCLVGGIPLVTTVVVLARLSDGLFVASPGATPRVELFRAPEVST